MSDPEGASQRVQLHDRVRQVTMYLSFVIYAISFVLPTLSGPGGTLPGIAAFFLSLLLAVFAIANLDLSSLVLSLLWLANPVFWLALVASSRWADRGATAFAGIALVLAAVPFAWVGSTKTSEHDVALTASAGYLVWVASMALLLVGSLFTLVLRRRSRTPTDAAGMSDV